MRKYSGKLCPQITKNETKFFHSEQYENGTKILLIFYAVLVINVPSKLCLETDKTMHTLVL